MDPIDEKSSEPDRIRAVYQAWLSPERVCAYAWHRPDVLAQKAHRNRIVSELLARSLGPDLSGVRVLDVGCGSGGFLRQLIDWGADPMRLIGTEYQSERLDLARLRTAPGVRWHLGELDFAPDASVELAVANTVFSSILDDGARAALAAEMWRTVMPGGWCMVFDLRVNNPRNDEVRRVTRAELARYWPGTDCLYRSLLLAPPIARRLTWAPRVLGELLAAAPFLRTHFVYMVRKPG